MIIAGEAWREIRSVLERAYPHEGCGFLVGHVDGDVRVLRQVSAHNRRESDAAAARRYLIDPGQFLATTRAVAREGLDVVGIYHSHPDVLPDPSAYDREHAWPWFHYLIVSVVGGTSAGVRAWQLADDRHGFVERPVRILD